MKKYQVFVSSTYLDLLEERKEVIQALLEMDCIPVGMELFPAADTDQWTLIKELINECDYYVLIIGGRYGSLNEGGISYTQMEYEYATQKGIPAISFLHKRPGSIPVDKTDKDEGKRIKLEDFKSLVGQKVCKYWETPEGLGAIVSRSLQKLIKDKPRAGWVKADTISSDEANFEILKLKQEIEGLKGKLELQSQEATEDLAQGEDLFEVRFYCKQFAYHYSKPELKGLEVSWNKLFAKTCTILLDEANEVEYKEHLERYVKFLAKKEYECQSVSVLKDCFLTILIQFKALGLIEYSQRKRLLKDTNTYWKLTEKGDALLTKLRALKRPLLDKEAVE